MGLSSPDLECLVEGPEKECLENLRLMEGYCDGIHSELLKPDPRRMIGL